MIDPKAPDFSVTPVSPGRARFDYVGADLEAGAYVSIITPFYDTGGVFHETARSVMQQSFQQWEWLIINDGSADEEALGILDEYRKKDVRIRVIDHETNKGLSAARNTGFREAQTEYVVQLDSDDLLEPTAVEKWFWFLESYPEYSFVKGYTVGFGAQEYLWQHGFHSGSAFLEENKVDATCMIRKKVHKAVGGYDEMNRGGLEDWDFWLRCASFGYWGATVPEYLDWYRRRPAVKEQWPNWHDGKGRADFHAEMRRRYPKLWNGGFPQIQTRWHMPNEAISDQLPCDNRLSKDKRRLLMIVPWLTTGGADKFNLDLVSEMISRGFEITIATTLNGDHSWLPEFTKHTPDVFALHRFLRLVDYPRFLRYLIQSRQIDIVMISNSEMGYQLLPYLRAHSPRVTFVDYAHMEEPGWKNGGYPRMAVQYQELLDLNLVSSEHLKQWMMERGAEPERIQVAYINVDPKDWRPDPQRRVELRKELEVDNAVPVILYAGRICLQKQPRVFAATMLQLRERGIPFYSWVAGDGPDLEWLRKFVLKHRLQKQVRLLGAVSIKRMQQLMSAADIFFLPSQWEGIALSIYEAMASGLPVVGADVGGQRELVTDECGVLIARSDEETEAARYVDVLTQFLENAESRAELGEASRARINTHFGLERMGNNLAILLEYAMGHHENSPGPIPHIELGRTHEAQAVDYARVCRLAETISDEHHRPRGIRAVFNRSDWRVCLYVVCRWLYYPFYCWGVRRNGAWFFPLAEKIKMSLLSSR